MILITAVNKVQKLDQPKVENLIIQYTCYTYWQIYISSFLSYLLTLRNSYLYV
jgi:hypothetical protein